MDERSFKNFSCSFGCLLPLLLKCRRFRRHISDIFLLYELIFQVLLSCLSPYFEAMFCRDFTEKNLDKVCIRGVTGRALTLIFNYFYSGTLKVCQETVEELLEISDIFLLEQVKYIFVDSTRAQLR